MNLSKKILSIIIVAMLVVTLFTGCSANNKKVKPDSNSEEVANMTLILSTTTSTQDSGLLDYLMPRFEEETGIEVKVVAVGTGKAIKMGEDGEADVLLVHAKSSEEEFVKAGHGPERFDVMYNDFVLVGPKDNISIGGQTATDNIIGALRFIAENQIKFISRGDDSGTHKKELDVWKASGIEPAGDWYISAGKGMGEILQMASEMQAYTLTDRATYLSMKEKLELDIAIQGDGNLFNQYGVIQVNPNKSDKINAVGAERFIQWILSENVQKLIGEFGKDKYGESLFVPNAK
jgi:tungstate transport system substrate-binding protein